MSEDGSVWIRMIEINGERLELEEAKETLTLCPEKQDIRGSTPRDADRCALARYARRVLKCRYPRFWGTIGYLDRTNKESKRVWMRFEMSIAAQRIIAEYDKTGLWKLGTCIVLKPPREAATLAHSEMRRREGRHDTRNGARRRIGRRQIDLSVRNGSASTNFIRVRKPV